MGRGWAILEGGNRAEVLMGSAVAVCYGDLNEGNDVRRIDRADRDDSHIAVAWEVPGRSEDDAGICACALQERSRSAEPAIGVRVSAAR